MKKLFGILAFVIAMFPLIGSAQEIQLGPNNIQVKGILQQLYGGTGSNQPIPTNCYGPTNALYWDPVAVKFGCNTISGGGGGVSVVAAVSSYMFTVNVATASTTPSITFTFGNTNNQVYVGTGAGTGYWTTIPECNGGNNALSFDNTLQSFGCNTITGGGGGGTTTNPVTFAGSGGASAGASFNGSSAVTIDYHTVGAPSVSGTGATGTWGINISGIASQVAQSVTFAAAGGATPSQVYNGSSAFTVDYHTVGAPSATGTGASGTWAISVTGNAGTASALASTPGLCSYGQFAYGILANGSGVCSPSNVTLTMPSGTPITYNTCTTSQTQSYIGVRSASTFTSAFATNPTAVNVWGANGGLVLMLWPDSSNDILDWSVCNQDNINITPGAMNINVGVK